MGPQFKSKSYATVWLIRASTSHRAHPKGWQLLPGNTFLIPYRDRHCCSWDSTQQNCKSAIKKKTDREKKEIKKHVPELC